MFANFAKKTHGVGGRSERKYVLNEVLAILDMANTEDMEREQIAKVTGRTKDSLNYKIFEGQTTIKGKTNVRSVKRFWFKDPKSKTSEQNDTPTAIRLLYTSYGVTAPADDAALEQDVADRIEAYIKSLEAVVVEETEAAEGNETTEEQAS